MTANDALYALLDSWLDAAVGMDFPANGWVGRAARYMADGIAADHPELLSALSSESHSARLRAKPVPRGEH